MKRVEHEVDRQALAACCEIHLEPSRQPREWADEAWKYLRLYQEATRRTRTRRGYGHAATWEQEMMLLTRTRMWECLIRGGFSFPDQAWQLRKLKPTV